MSDRFVSRRPPGYIPTARGRRVHLVRCPVCDSATVTVVLNSKPHASCACCGATWIQEGSWQRSIRQAGPKAPLPDDVIPLPSPAARERTPLGAVADPAEEAVGS